ncbi:agmatine deiminase family protein [Helicobacter sp. MIT 99-5507]|uniref:agmatine deiminase family protein n=1 Tax=Helicobacter sp. MIT 99-5507 TaxID=152489 RepID=UPI000E1E2CD5|nr:agmatine deiminase family protein [Helicobacter sp. MIT 99-5507]RDU58658.1 agmatine deiminase [Helicobacter sp. MIT 99-5507]
MQNKELRFIGEWEKQSYTILAMPHIDSDWSEYLIEAQDKMIRFAKEIARFQKVIMLYKYEKDIKKLKNNKQILLINIATNDTWCRDFCMISCKKNNKIVFLDFVFNAWGMKYPAYLDNQVSRKLFATNIFKNTKLKSKHFILEGGSIDSNGNGIILTTSTCLLEKNRNNISKEKITKKLKKYFNVKKILWLDNGYLSGDDTDCHIDNLARFVDKNTICYLKCYDENDEHFHALNKMENELKKLKNLDNKSFSLIPIPMPKAVFYKNKRLPASYINFLFINNALLVPIFDDENDKIAINIFKKICKDREIIPIDSRIFLRQGGSLHCLSMNVAKI